VEMAKSLMEMANPSLI